MSIIFGWNLVCNVSGQNQYSFVHLAVFFSFCISSEGIF